MSVPPRVADPPVRRGWIGARLDRLSEGQFLAVVATPGLLLGLVVVAIPLAIAVAFSLFRLELAKDGITPFVALRNFIVRLPADTEFLGTLPVTFGFAAITTLIALPIALGIALLVHGQRRFQGLFVVLLLLPWAVAPIANGLFWGITFARFGPVNDTLHNLGLPRVVLDDAPGQLLVMGIAILWRSIPLLALLLLGALGQVPRELQSAARVDGATTRQVVRYVTLPAIGPTVVAACVLLFILTAQTFDVQYGLAGDHPPAGATLSAVEIYRVVYEQVSLGYASAQTVVVAILTGLSILVAWLIASGPGRRQRARPVSGESAAARSGSVLSPTVGHSRPVGPVRAREPVEPAPTMVRSSTRAVRSIGRRARRMLPGCLMVALAVVLLAPLAWIVLLSVGQDRFILHMPPILRPTLELDGYRLPLGLAAWRGAAIMSVGIATGATALALAAGTLMAYPLARLGNRATRPLLAVLLAMLLIPPIALAIPLVNVVIRLNIRDTALGLIIVNAALWTPILVWLARAAFLSAPRNLEWAARMDGASRVGAIVRVLVPAAAPGIAAAAAITFVGIWNDFVFATVIGGPDTFTLTRYLGQSATPNTVYFTAAIVLAVAPCVLLVVLLRRQIFGLLGAAER